MNDLPDLDPAPLTVVSLTRSIIPQPSSTPETMTTPPLAAAAESAEQEVTVVPLPLPPPVVPEAYPTSPLMAAAPHVFVAVAAGPVDVVEAGLDVAVVVLVARVLVVVAAAAEKAQVHSLEMALGLFEQFEAHGGRPVVAVAEEAVYVLQNAEAVALLAVMKEAQGSVSGLVQASTRAGNIKRASGLRRHMLGNISTVQTLLASRGVGNPTHTRQSFGNITTQPD